MIHSFTGSGHKKKHFLRDQHFKIYHSGGKCTLMYNSRRKLNVLTYNVLKEDYKNGFHVVYSNTFQKSFG